MPAQKNAKQLDETLPAGYQKAATLQANSSSQCRLSLDGELVYLIGQLDDTSTSMLRQLGGSLRELMTGLLSIRAADIRQNFQLVFNRNGSGYQLRIDFFVPAALTDQVQSDEFKNALQLYGCEICGDVQEDAPKLGKTQVALIHKVTQNFKKNHGRKVLPSGLELVADCQDRPVAFAAEVAAADRIESVGGQKIVRGAFRGYHIEGRVAYFLPAGGMRKKAIEMSFDEEKFFQQIQTLSRREFTACNVEYVEHYKDGSLDYSQLINISQVDSDLFE